MDQLQRLLGELEAALTQDAARVEEPVSAAL